MNFIRQQRASKHFEPNQKHLIYGMDADLIFLGLTLHEPQFYIIRETVSSTGGPMLGKFELIIINELRLLIQQEFGSFDSWTKKESSDKNQGPDLERVIDDIVFLCFLVGNDFLPHIHSMDISEGALDCLFAIYRKQLPAMPDYLTNRTMARFN